MRIDYGKNGINLSLNPLWNLTVLRPKEQKGLVEPIEKIRETIKNPLECEPLYKIIKSKKTLNRICIVVSDSTRPVPSHIILGALIKELNEYGIQDNQISILIATGLHRTSREDELVRILGENLRSRLKIIDHVASDKDSLKYLGKTREDSPIYINKYFYESDVKILTGYVEPHFFFGFSGGRKALIPGIAGEETIQANHSAKNIDSPHSRFGIYKNNLMHKMAIEILNLVGVDFAINTCINEKHEIVEVLAGDVEKIHEELVKYQLKHIFEKIDEPYDIVICGNGGYPLDLNLYQAVKSMAIGEMAVKKGGTIISVNECIDGIGIGQDKFKQLIFSGMEPNDIYKKILNKKIVVPEQWEIQVLARILMKSEIFVVSKLKENELGNIGLKYGESVEDVIKLSLRKYGDNASILILPNGPQILPLLKEKK
ncbi:MAG: nickel-dependent lactate racemase [Candidatus Thorarchaeota archaeon]